MRVIIREYYEVDWQPLLIAITLIITWICGAWAGVDYMKRHPDLVKQPTAKKEGEYE